MAEALQALLASLCFGRIHVVGYSLGARVALELCTHTGPPASLALALLSSFFSHALHHDDSTVSLPPCMSLSDSRRWLAHWKDVQLYVRFLTAQGSLLCL